MAVEPTSRSPSGPERGQGVLRAIALFKLFKAALLIAIGIGALSLVHDDDVAATLREGVSALRFDPNNQLIHGAIAKISGLDTRRLHELSLGTFVYAAVFLVEGTGLLLRKHWAEYLTTLMTASFIPFEIYELWHHPSSMKAVAIVLNALIVWYLARRLWPPRSGVLARQA
jgi:uncharacterized membrane protein (DUF2068 family)